MNFKHKSVMLILLLLLICLSVGGVSASEDASGVSNTTTVLSESISVDSDNDVVGGLESSVPDGDVLGADGDGTFTDLQNDINDAIYTTGVFNMNRSYIYTNGTDSEDLRYGVTVSAPLIINGNNTYYIDGASLARIMQVYSDNVQFNNVTFQNGYRAVNTNDFQGAAVYCENFNNISFNGCKFTGNGQTVFYPGTTTRAQALGLCIYANNGTDLNIRGCTFTGVSGTGINTGVCCYKVDNITFYRCTFSRMFNGIYVSGGSNMANLSYLTLNTSPRTESWNGNISFTFVLYDVLNVSCDHGNFGGGNYRLYYIMGIYRAEYINLTSNTFNSFFANGGSQVLHIEDVKTYCYLYGNVFTNFNMDYTKDRMVYIDGIRATARLEIISDRMANCYGPRVNHYQINEFNYVLMDHFTFNGNNRETDQDREMVYIGNIDNLNLTYCTFDNSYAGRILRFINIINCTISYCTFNNLRGRLSGAVLYFSTTNNLVFEYCKVTACYCNAGATYAVSSAMIDFDYSAGKAYVYKCTFDNLYSTNIIQGFGNCEVDSCTFNNYRIRGTIAYGFFYNNGGNLLVHNSTFTGSYSNGMGSALYNAGANGVANFTNNTFRNLYAETGGVLYSVGKTLIADNNTFINDYATASSGVIYSTSTNAHIFYNNITDCYSQGEVGAFTVSGSNAVVAYNNFNNIQAASDYGVVYSNGGTFRDNNYTDIFANNLGAFGIGSNVNLIGENFTNTHVDGANSWAGVLYLSGNNNNIINTTMFNSSATDGGAIYNAGNNNHLENVSINSTRALGYGGALYSLGSLLTVKNISIYNASSVLDGGAIGVIGGDTSFDGVSIDYVWSSRDGGAIYWTGDNGKITDINITNVNATRFGGSILWQGNNGNISGIKINNSIGWVIMVLYMILLLIMYILLLMVVHYI